MKFALLAITALFGLSAAQEAQQDSSAPAASPAAAAAAEGVKQYVVSFEDEVSSQDFDAVSKWIKDNQGEIIESINENFAKLIIAKMDDSIMKLNTEFPNRVIESIEEDTMDWDEEEAHDEL